MTPPALSYVERDAFVLELEKEFCWTDVTARWSRYTTAEARAADRELWLVEVAALLTQLVSP